MATGNVHRVELRTRTLNGFWGAGGTVWELGHLVPEKAPDGLLTGRMGLTQEILRVDYVSDMHHRTEYEAISEVLAVLGSASRKITGETDG